MLNMVTNAGTVLAYNALSPKFADISQAYAYSILLVNQTATDVVAGDFTIETASALAADPCSPDPATWAPLQVVPECDSLPGAVTGPAKITLSAQNPVKAHSVCAFAAPCPNQFVRVAPSGATTLDVLCVLTRLKRAWL